MSESQQVIKARIRRATLEAHRAMDRLDKKAMDRLGAMYREAAEDIKRRMTLFVGSGDTIPLSELETLLGIVRQRLKVLASNRNTMLDDELRAAAQLGVKPFIDAIYNEYSGRQVIDETLRLVRNFVAGDGLQLSDRIWRLDRQALETVTNAIEDAVIQGHGATQAARDLLLRNEPIPLDIQNKIQTSNVNAIGKKILLDLTTSGSPMDNAMRVFRTEINRAHGEAYISSSFSHPDAAGVRYMLSPAHPRPDICDLHASANLYGLGAGVYPSREKCPWPAHPNILSYLVVVFKDEVTEQDRAGAESVMQALNRLSPAQQVGVLGKNKYEAFKRGLLKPNMINSQWKSVRRRIGEYKEIPAIQKPEPKTPTPKRPTAQTLDTFIAAGVPIATRLLQGATTGGRLNGAKFLEDLHSELKASRPMMTEAKVEGKGVGADFVKAASRLFPDDWTKLADRYGTLYAKFSTSRGYQVSFPKEYAGRPYRIMGRSGIARGGEGFIQTGSFSTTVHEYAHRLQHTVPGLDDIFQDLHRRRTEGDPLKSLRSLFPGVAYDRSEVAQEDKYRNAYQGKVYSGHDYLGKYGALEVMTMAFEDVLGGQYHRLEELAQKDREMLDLVIGLLFNYVP